MDIVLRVSDLKPGFPIYYISGHGVYGCKDDIVWKIRECRDGRIEILYFNTSRPGLNGSHFADPDDEVQLWPNKDLTLLRYYVVEIKAFLYRTLNRKRYGE